MDDNQDINILATVKPTEKGGMEIYIFLYYDENRDKILRIFDRFASNPELSFTWFDAEIQSKKVRRQCCQQEWLLSDRFSIPLQ